MPESTSIDGRLNEAAAQYIEAIGSLTENTFVQDGIVKAAVSEIIWALFERYPESRHALAEILEDFDAVVKNEIVRLSNEEQASTRSVTPKAMKE